MVVATQVRAGRATALLVGFQSARGTPLSSFITAATKRIWTAEAELLPAPIKSSQNWETQGLGADAAERYSVAEKPEGSILAHATPDSLEWLLRSNFGPFSGGTFSLAGQVAATGWLTLAWVENTASGSGQKLVRIQDAWFHLLRLEADGAEGPLSVVGRYAGRAIFQQDLNAGGVTLPSSYAPNLNVFAARSVTLRRDPSGANISLRISRLALELDQKLDYEWDEMSGLFDPHKSGRLRAKLELTAEVADETWDLIENARAGTKQRFRIVATAPNPAKTLTIDLHNLDFEFEPVGHDGREYLALVARGDAHVSGTDFVTVTLT